jgi:hypothetical protein
MLSLSIEISDVLDELKIIRTLVKQQRDVLRDLQQALREHNPPSNAEGKEPTPYCIQRVIAADGHLERFLSSIDAVNSDAQNTHKMVSAIRL